MSILGAHYQGHLNVGVYCRDLAAATTMGTPNVTNAQSWVAAALVAGDDDYASALTSITAAGLTPILGTKASEFDGTKDGFRAYLTCIRGQDEAYDPMDPIPATIAPFFQPVDFPSSWIHCCSHTPRYISILVYFRDLAAATNNAGAATQAQDFTVANTTLAAADVEWGLITAELAADLASGSIIDQRDDTVVSMYDNTKVGIEYVLYCSTDETYIPTTIAGGFDADIDPFAMSFTVPQSFIHCCGGG